MTELDQWLKTATRRLSGDSAAQVRAEIGEHFESSREAALAAGASADEASRLALTALGDAHAANREYRRVLLTATEAKLLRQGNREARFICSRLWARALLAAGSVSACWLAAVLFLAGASAWARVALAAALGLSLLFVAPLFPIYTPSRSRIYRAVKWLVEIAFLTVAFGPDALRMFWLIAICMWSFFRPEWTRASIRRKLPVERWPRHLYL